jgi:hypothetical protein
VTIKGELRKEELKANDSKGKDIIVRAKDS